MTQILDAVFENGMFRPVKPIALTEGQTVRLVVETDTAEDILILAAKVYEGLSDDDVRAVEQISLDRRDWFKRTAN